jgi:hypothetical protein
MNFAFWFAPAAAFVICIARSDLGRAAADKGWAAATVLRNRVRSLLGQGFAGPVVRAR